MELLLTKKRNIFFDVRVVLLEVEHLHVFLLLSWFKIIKKYLAHFEEETIVDFIKFYF